VSVLSALGAQPALTIYNQNFAVVRDTVSLDLKGGVNQVRYTDATAQVEPDSVILRDPGGKRSLQILEQNYRNDPVSQELLLSLFEGKTIDFETIGAIDPQKREIVRGKIIRSGYARSSEGPGQPIVEVNGRVRFGLPGLPLFPGLGDDTVLKPTLNWVIQSSEPGKLDAEVSYLTGGFNWSADYNLVAPEKGDRVDLIGWIVMDNESGKTFRDAKIKLLAGDVNKIRPVMMTFGSGGGGGFGGGGAPPAVTEKSFDEYHLYTVARPTTLLDRQKKQVEFVHAMDVKAPTLYVYDGATPDCRFSGTLNENPRYGTSSNKKVWVMREFVNSEANHLGIALPKGKVRFYRRNDDAQMEFTGEDMIDHTPRDETVRVTTGNSFDLVGERQLTDFKHLNTIDPTTGLPMAIDPATGLPVRNLPVPPSQPIPIDPATGLPLPPNSPMTPGTNLSIVSYTWSWIDESFEITLRNHKSEPVEIRVVEHLWRWSNWNIKEKSDPFIKTDAQTIEFRITVKPDEERKVTYTAHYWW
jgi:hypothetical protein